MGLGLEAVDYIIIEIIIGIFLNVYISCNFPDLFVYTAGYCCHKAIVYFPLEPGMV